MKCIALQLRGLQNSDWEKGKVCIYQFHLPFGSTSAMMLSEMLFNTLKVGTRGKYICKYLLQWLLFKYQAYILLWHFQTISTEPYICLVNFCLNPTLTLKVLLYYLRQIQIVILLPAIPQTVEAPRIPQTVEEEDVARGSLQHIPNILKQKTIFLPKKIIQWLTGPAKNAVAHDHHQTRVWTGPSPPRV